MYAQHSFPPRCSFLGQTGFPEERSTWWLDDSQHDHTIDTSTVLCHVFPILHSPLQNTNPNNYDFRRLESLSTGRQVFLLSIWPLRIWDKYSVCFAHFWICMMCLYCVCAYPGVHRADERLYVVLDRVEHCYDPWSVLKVYNICTCRRRMYLPMVCVVV